MIEKALTTNKQPFAKYLQLVTVKPNGRPTARTVVFRCSSRRGWRSEVACAARENPHLKLQPPQTPACRGFSGDEGVDGLSFVTDMRSAKVDEVAQNPFGHLCWYMEDSREQFRLDGRIQIIGPSNTDVKLQAVRFSG